jgi:predicted transcriptional regulator
MAIRRPAWWQVSVDDVVDAVVWRLTEAAAYGEHAQVITSVADYYRRE